MGKKRTFRIDNDIVDIPVEEVDVFLKEVPSAKEVQSFLIDKDTVDIPIEEVEVFKSEVPDAKPLFTEDADTTDAPMTPPMATGRDNPDEDLPSVTLEEGGEVSPVVKIDKKMRDVFVDHATKLPDNIKLDGTRSNIFISQFSKRTGVDKRALRKIFNEGIMADEQFKQLQKQYEQDPDNTDVLYQIGGLLNVLGRHDLAYEAYDALEGKLYKKGVEEYSDPNNPNKRPDYVQQRQLPAIAGMAYTEELRGNKDNAQRLKKIAEQYGYSGQEFTSVGDGSYQQPTNPTPSTYGFSGKKGGDSLPTKESEYLNMIADGVGQVTLIKPMSEMVSHGLDKVAKGLNAPPSSATEGIGIPSANRTLNLVTGLVETAMGVAGMTTPAGAVFGLPFMQVQNSLPPDVVEWMMPVSKTIQEYYKQQGQEVPDWATNVAVLSDFAVMAGLLHGVGSAGQETLAKAKSNAIGKQVGKLMSDMPLEEVSQTLNHIEGKIQELGGVEQYVAERTKVLPEIAKRAEEIKQDIKLEQDSQIEVEPYEPTPQPNSLATVKDGTSVMMDGKEGIIERGDDGTWYFLDDEGKSTQIKVEDKYNPTEPLTELGIQVMPEVSPQQIARAMADAERVGDTNYKGKEYFVSIDRVGNENPNGDFVLRRMPDGTLKDVFDSHPDPKFAKERKLAIINQFLAEKGLPSRKKLTEVGKKAAEKPAEPVVEEIVEPIAEKPIEPIVEEPIIAEPAKPEPIKEAPPVEAEGIAATEDAVTPEVVKKASKPKEETNRNTVLSDVDKYNSLPKKERQTVGANLFAKIKSEGKKLGWDVSYNDKGDIIMLNKKGKRQKKSPVKMTEDERNIKLERQKNWREAMGASPVDIRHGVLQFLLRGGSFNYKALDAYVGYKNPSEYPAFIRSEKGMAMDDFYTLLKEDMPELERMDDHEFGNLVGDVISEFGDRTSMHDAILEYAGEGSEWRNSGLGFESKEHYLRDLEGRMEAAREREELQAKVDEQDYVRAMEMAESLTDAEVDQMMKDLDNNFPKTEEEINTFYEENGFPEDVVDREIGDTPSIKEAGEDLEAIRKDLEEREREKSIAQAKDDVLQAKKELEIERKRVDEILKDDQQGDIFGKKEASPLDVRPEQKAREKALKQAQDKYDDAVKNLKKVSPKETVELTPELPKEEKPVVEVGEQSEVGSNATFEHAGQSKRGVITEITDTGYIIEDGSGRKFPVKKEKATIVEMKPIETLQAEAKGNEFTEMYGADYSPGGTVGTQVPVGGQPSYSPSQTANIVNGGGRVPVDPIRGVKPKKLRDIVFDVTRSLSSRLIYSMSGRRKALGSYSPSSGGMKVKFNNDLDTIAHELGHLLDDRHGILPEAEKSSNWSTIESELMQFSQHGSKPPSSLNAAQAKRYTLGEGVAEWVRAYLVNPIEAKRLAPEFTKLYETHIPSEVKQKISDFGTDIRTFAGASEHDMIMSNVRMQPDAKQNFISSLLKPKKIGGSEFTISPLDRLAVNFWNPLKITDKAFKIATELHGKTAKDIAYGDNPHILARLLLGAGEKFMDFVKTGLRDAQGELIIDPVTGEYVSLDYMLKAFDSTTEGTLMAEMERAASYMIAERTVELAKRFDRESGLSGIGGGLATDLSVAKGRLLEHNNSSPAEKARIEEATRRYRLIGDATLRYMVEKGRMHYDTYKLIKDNNLQYVAMKRIMETEPGGDYNFVFKSSSGKLGIKKEVVKSIQGSYKTIENPFSSLMDDIYKITKESDRNDFMRAFVEPLFSKRGMYDGTVKELADIGQVVPEGTKNSIVVYLDGNPVSFLFHPDIHKGLTAFDNVINLPGVVTALPKLLRWTVTHFPVFAAKNWMRDVQQRVIVSGSGIKTLFGNKMDRHNLAAAGGLNSGFYFRDQSYYYDLMGEAISRVSKQNNSIVINPKKFGRYWDKYTDLLQSAERANRIAEYRSAFKQAKKEGHSDYDASVYAAYRSRDLLDFSFQGEQMKWINQIIPFSNAAIQGLRKASLSAKANPKAFAARLALYSVVPTLAEWAWNHKDKETAQEYENLPSYKRDLFYNFKVGNVFVSVPKPYEISLMGASVSRGLSQMNGNKKAFDGYSGTVAQSMMPFNESNILGPMQTLGEAITNKDLFRDQYIVPVYEENLDMRFRHTNRSSRVGQLTSKGLDAIDIEVDPRKIDFVIKDLFSYFGKTGLKLSDLGKGSGTNKFDVTDIGFLTLPPGPTSKAYMDLQEYAKKNNLIRSKDYKDISALITDYYNADNDGKERIGKQIINESKALLEKFEEQGKELGDFYDLKSDAIKYELTKDDDYQKLLDKVSSYKKDKSPEKLKKIEERTSKLRDKWSAKGYEPSDSEN